MSSAKSAKGTPLSEILSSYGGGSDRLTYDEIDPKNDISQVYDPLLSSSSSDIFTSIRSRIRQDPDSNNRQYQSSSISYLGRNLPREVLSDDGFDFSSSDGEENSDGYNSEDNKHDNSVSKASIFEYNEQTGFTKIFKPKTNRRFSMTLMTRPLLVNNSRLLQKERFKDLLAGALKQKLPEIENIKFLEQFRYILVTSQLLDERIPNSKIDHHSQGNRVDAKLRLNVRGNDKFWVSGSGCIVVVSLLLHWSIKSGKIHSSKKKNLGMFVLVLCIACFLFSYSRKKLLRLLREHALVKSRRFIENSREFDYSVSKCLKIIQEVELFSRGYRPDLSDYNSQHLYPNNASNLLPPISRIERQDDLKLCKHLRSSLSSTLYLSIINLLTAVKLLRTLCIGTDLERYLDIYEVDLSDLDIFTSEDLEEREDNNGAGTGSANRTSFKGHEKKQSFAAFDSGDTTFGFDENLDNFEQSFQSKNASFRGSLGANISIKNLRYYYHKMHLIRRILICCLLSMSANENDYQEFKRWRKIVANLDKSSTLMKNLSESILDTIYMVEVDSELDGKTTNYQQKEETTENSMKSKAKWKPHLKSLDSISFSLRHVEARMQIAKEESIKIAKASKLDFDLSQSSHNSSHVLLDDPEQNAVIKNYDEIGNELKSLLKAWETGKNQLKHALDPATYIGTTISTSIGVIPEEIHDELERPMTPVGQEYGSIVSNATTYIDDYFGSMGETKMTILEAIADDDYKKRNGLKGLTREQRIHKVKEMRSKESERRAESEKHNHLMLELKNVLETNRRY